MGDPVTLPLWLVGLLVVLAGTALLDRLFMPGFRWFFRRKVKEVIQHLNDRLQIEIQPFKLTRRQSLIDRIVYDAQVLQAAEGWAEENDMPREAAMVKVKIYAGEIVPAFNAYLYFRVGYWLAKRVARALYRVRLGFTDEEGLRGVPSNATVIFLMNHRSNMDYILVTFFAASRTALSYAVGEWARIWPLQTLIRSLGAYFVRRRSGNTLYRKVLERYVQIATQEGVTQAVFPEGGLSRDGRLQQPKLGLLDYLLRSYDPDSPRDLVFIPVGVNYDRTLEDRTLLLDKQDQPKKGRLFAATNTLRFLGHHLALMLRGHWFRFGYACVNFGTPFSVKTYLAETGQDFRKLERAARFEKVAELADRLMKEVGSMVPVLPVPLVASVLNRNPQAWLDELEIKARVHQLIQDLEARGAHIYVPRQDMDYGIVVGLRMLRLRHLIRLENGLYQVEPNQQHVLQYYANALLHFYSEGEVVSESSAVGCQ